MDREVMHCLEHDTFIRGKVDNNRAFFESEEKMYRAYLIVFALSLGFMFQSCATLEYFDGSSEKEITKFKMTKEEMWREIEGLRAENAELRRQIIISRKENQTSRNQNALLTEELTKLREENRAMRDETENKMATMRNQNALLTEELTKLREENRAMRDETENKMATMRNQNALLTEELTKLREENRAMRDEDRILAERRTKVQLPYAAVSPESKKEVKPMYVLGRSVRVRSGPGMDYRVTGVRRFGERVFTKDLKGDWYRIVSAKGFRKTIGWIHRSLLREVLP
jgi:hypothetical protein